MKSSTLKRLLRHKGSWIGIFLVLLFTLLSLFPFIFTPHEPAKIFEDSYKLSPFATASVFHFLGTDDLGRDLYTRLIYGARISMSVGLGVVILSSIIGTSLGLLAGYFGGFLDKSIMRFVDALMALPSVLLAIVVVAILGPGLRNTVFAVSIVSIPAFIRIVRASVIEEKAKDYVNASRSLGAGHIRILILNILPNCMAPLIVQMTLSFSDGILNIAALGFLGLGAQPPLAEWGTMLSDARPYIESAPWMVTLPGICILFCVLGFNLLGDGLRDALDPKLRN